MIEGSLPPPPPPPFRKDRDAHGGGLVIYVREDIPSNLLKPQTLPENIETIFIELNLKNTKWLLIGGYNPNKNSICYFLNQISHEIDTKLHKYENLLLLGDFNAVSSDHAFNEFCHTYHLKNLISEPTCFKNALNPSSIDVILTNRKSCFHDSKAIETGLSDHHKMILSVLKSNFEKGILYKYTIEHTRTLMKFHSDMIYLRPFSCVFSLSQLMMNSKIFI